MTRIDLKVPFSDKDEAKKLGARWDASSKVWFVPAGVGSSAFQRWMPSVPDLRVRANSYSIAQTTESCWKCGDLTRVYGFLLPTGHQVFETDDDGVADWNEHDYPSMVAYVTDLPAAAAARIKAATTRYFLDFSKTTNSSYWMNHCEHCGMKQGDFAMYCEPGGAFYPMDEDAVSSIKLEAVSAPFSCNGETSYDDLLDEMMR